MGCLIAIFTYPYRFIRWGLTSGKAGYITLGIVSLILIITAVSFWSSCIDTNDKQDTDQINIPTISEAPYQITTDTRVYYAGKAIKDKAGIVTMTVYWEFLSIEWVKNPGVLQLDSRFGDIIISKRR